MKKKKTFKLPLLFMECVILCYFITITYFKEIVSPVSNLLTPFMGVFIVFYNVVYSGTLFIMAIIMIMMYFMTYTYKFNSALEVSTIEGKIKKSSKFKVIVNVLASILMVYYSYSLGYKYLSIITSVGLVL